MPMRTTQIQFDEDETPESVARRIVYAFNVGNVLKIRDKFFKVTGIRSINIISSEAVQGDNYILVLPKEKTLPPPVPEDPKPIPEDPKPIPEDPKPIPEDPKPIPEDPKPIPEDPKTVPEDPLVEPPPAPEETPKGPSTEGLHTNSLPKVGQRWKPKDPRRKGTFLVVSIDRSFVYCDDGRKVSVSRMNRYQRV